jgi:hypothetical protein
MDQDRSLKDLIRFLDPSGDMSDADIADLTSKLKFTEVLDLISNVGKDDLDAARSILNNYDTRFSVAKEYTAVPTKPAGGGFKPIKPQGTVGQLPSTAPSTQQAGGQPSTQQAGGQPANAAQGQNNQNTELSGDDLTGMLDDPSNQSNPDVKQIKSLLQRLQQR